MLHLIMGYHSVCIILAVLVHFSRGYIIDGIVNDVVMVEYNPEDTTTKVITSPHLDGKTLYVYETNYIITKATTSAFFRLIATDFVLAPGSVLKIYDGLEVTSPLYTYTQSSQRPILQSTSNSIRIVYKPAIGDTGWWTLEYTIVTDQRESWNSVPSLGYCGVLHDNGDHGTMVTSTVKPGYYDCIWVISYTYAERTLNISLTKGWIEGSGLTVRSGFRSTSPIIYPTITSQYNTSLVFHGNKWYPWYIHLQGHVTGSGSLRLAFDSETSRSKGITAGELLSTLHPATESVLRQLCPYKSCLQPHGPSTCKMYWEPCYNYVDSSCDNSVEFNVRCALMTSTVGDGHHPVRHCYREEYDVCDGYKDCDAGTDEEYQCVYPTTETTEGDETTPGEWATSGFGLLVFGFIYLCLKSKCRCMQWKIECCCCFHGCCQRLEECCGGIDDICGSVRVCCERVAARVDNHGQRSISGTTTNTTVPRDISTNTVITAISIDTVSSDISTDSSSDPPSPSEVVVVVDSTHPSLPPPSYDEAIDTGAQSLLIGQRPTAPPALETSYESHPDISPQHRGIPIRGPYRARPAGNSQETLLPTYDEATCDLTQDNDTERPPPSYDSVV